LHDPQAFHHRRRGGRVDPGDGEPEPGAAQPLQSPPQREAERVGRIPPLGKPVRHLGTGRPADRRDLPLPEVTAQGWLIITRDRMIQHHRREIAAMRENEARMVTLAGGEAIDTRDSWRSSCASGGPSSAV
jgi:hypothetical protein